MNRRAQAFTVGVTGLALTLAACGGGTGASDTGSDGGDGKVDSIKLVAAEYSSETQGFWQDFAKTYEEKTGTELEVQVVSWDDIDQQSSTMIQNGNPPDILNLNAYASYAKDGLLYSADEVLSPDVKSDLLPNFVTSGTYDGKLYGMPDLSSARALFYNKDLFEKAGIDAPPTTWDEFAADAKKIKDTGDGAAGYAEPLGPEEAQAEFSIWMFNNGGNWKTDGKWSINSAPNVETLEFLKKLSTDGVTQNNPGKTNRTDGAFADFAAGKAGMVVGFSPLAAQLDEAKKVEYGVAPMPSNTGDEPKSYGVTDYLMAFKKDGNAEAVKAFYDLYYQTDQVNTFIENEGFLPVTRSGVEKFSSDADLKVYLDTLTGVQLTPTDDPTWDTIKLAVQQEIGAAVGPDGDPKAILDDLQKQAESGS
ncbi:extracellular solute-binding protein [Kineosporia succinea]|uniref:Multiple sugar transport system substrate-binding protein n=1 Tax=Kineosporia succinea TaxID=84632 RepID=A0ABT9NZH8_9ACTN|nr:extracellular solute-binding protein [Kineosporia succinea]MDP9825838.1 multiple sugar transport system substrate-binding protein [Kineosporia succinea]